MRPTFLPRLVNGPHHDPVLYLRVLNAGKALMLDCGHFRRVANRELLALEALCVSHAHMDHFMGFDLVLRTILHREEPLDVYGPAGIIDRTAARLQGYTWNLTQGYPLEIRVHEVEEDRVTSARARADGGFVMGSSEALPREGSLVAHKPRYRIDAAVLDHRGIPCLAFAVQEPFHVGIRRGALESRGYLPGPWLGALKESILAGRPDDAVEVKTAGGGRCVPVGELEGELTMKTPGQAIAFVTDIAFTGANLAGLEAVAKGVDLLFIETFCLDEFAGLAREKGHLTAGQAGMIASRLGARRTVPMHVSPRYRGGMEAFYREMGIRPDGAPSLARAVILP
jgi:ribonuclease Z